MAGPLKFGDFKRKFTKYGVSITVKGSHIRMEKRIGGVVCRYVAVVHHNRVDPVYVAKARRRFKLLPQDGVTDRQFRKA